MRKTIQVPNTGTYTKTESITCDICKVEFKCNPSQYSGCTNWGKGFDVCETTILLEKGYHYPEGGCTTKTFYDICPACFEKQLMPALAAMGAKPTIKDVEV